VFNVANRTHVFSQNSTLYARNTNCFNTNGMTTNNPNGLCRTTQFGEVTGTDSTLYRERQVQFAARFQF
jgi:hypothetical protein